MSVVLAILLVAVLLVVYCTSCSKGPVGSAVKALKSKLSGKCGCSGFSGAEGMTVDESTRMVAKLDNVFGKEDTAPPDDAVAASGVDSGYDPIQMGALKQSEVDAHKRGIAEMTPFNTYGPAGPDKTLRDDDEYIRNTGVVWIGGRPRTVNKVASGPQAGARAVTSASEKDIRETHLISMHEPTWG